MKNLHPWYLWAAIGALLLASLACNFPGFPGADVPASTPSDVAPTATSTSDESSPTSTAEATPDVTPSPTADDEDCVLRAAFVDDITIPDDTEMNPGEEFVKTWRIRNSSTCAWEDGTLLVPIAGDDLGGPESVTVPNVEPEDEIELSVTLVAPEEPGSYRSNWQLQTPEGQNFGGIFYAQIVVPGEEPIVTPTALSEEPAPPQELLARVSEDCDQVTFTWVDGQGEGAYRLEGPDLNERLDANTTTYVWRDPPAGTSMITLIAEDPEGRPIGRIETFISVACGEDRPDLSVEGIRFEPRRPVARLPVEVTVRIRNRGEVDSGGFVVHWRSLKTASTSTCRWVVEEGLRAGETQDLRCTTVAYTSPYSELVTAVDIDATELINEANERNNTLEETLRVVSPVVVYDLVGEADQATWTAGPATTSLPWSGSLDAEEGYARWTSGTLETGSAIDGVCLETHPNRTTGGWVRGEFDDIGTVTSGDRLEVAVGMLADASQGAVTYRVLLVPEDAQATRVIEMRHNYGEGIEVLSADLSEYRGKRAAVILEVDAGESPEHDRACWLGAAIYRYP